MKINLIALILICLAFLTLYITSVVYVLSEVERNVEPVEPVKENVTIKSRVQNHIIGNYEELEF